MEITCERYEKRHLGAVRRFNQRMRERGVDPAYLLPTEVQDEPPGDPAPPIWSEYILAVESDTTKGSEVRGAYLAQWRKFLVMGEERRLGNYQTPISEGIIDRKYTSVGIASLKFAMRSNPYWYTVGMGGLDRPLPKILRSFGWNLRLVPFWFRVHNANRFLKEVRHLRTTAARRAALDALRCCGAGWLGLKALQGIAAARLPSLKLETHVVDRFDEATDEFWDRVSGHYRFAAVRTAAALNLLYPPDDTRYRRILVNVNGLTIGWAVLLAHPLSGNKYFGNMRAGVIADCMAAPADMLPVMVGAGRELDKMGIDISLANTLHPAAIDALRRAGYLSGPTNYGFGLSKPLAALMTPIEQSIEQVHLTRGDGDGLANFSVRPAGRNDAE